MDQTNQLRMLVYASLMSALIAVGAFISVPVGPVPIVLQNLFVLLAGLLLGKRWALAAVAVYLLAGACGLPVFAGGTGGIGRILGPTGGYLAGFLAAAWIGGWAAEHGKGAVLWDIVGVVAASLLIYLCGIPWLKYIAGIDWAKAVAVGMIPFLFGDVLKMAVAVSLAKTLRPLMNLEFATGAKGD